MLPKLNVVVSDTKMQLALLSGVLIITFNRWFTSARGQG
jgi:hypothetical protein